ncbi:MAG TPA: LLM class flavin-dependent oxidoreductase [Candidatus Thermoplasmatota archaeon]|nr:LLM class flavin-dependent oxidoreductase [Candidatus Thermoplasmatota archaeon]
MEIGIYTFGDHLPNPVTGEAATPREKLRQAVRLAKLADEVGLDVFAVGEHHRLDMAISSPAVVLAAAAEATQRIRLSSATTVLNTLDPVRVFEDFATLDLLSGGRAEIIAGRGSFTENFELFGHDLKDYDALFVENLDLLLRLNREERVTWQGRFRPPLRDAEAAPRPERPIPVWIGMGGTPQSAARAGRMGLPLNIAILGGPRRFVPFAELYRQSAQQAGHAAAARLAVSSHGYIADDGAQARAEHWEIYGRNMRKGLRNRFPPMDIPREAYEQETGPHGGIFAGDAKETVEKVLWERRLLGIDRLLLQLDWGGVPFPKVCRGVEILGAEVLPAVRKALEGR